jgi:hypothetical protein
MSEPAGDIAFGPKMAALSPKHQKFVVAYFDERAGSSVRARLTFAAVAAGYAGGSGKRDARRVLEYQGWRVSSYPAVKAAMEEEGRRRNRLVLPIALSAARAVLADPKHRDHGKLIMYYLSLIDPPAQQLDLKVEHTAPSVEATAEVIARIAELARQTGAALPPPTPTIEGEAIEVPSDDE